MRCWKAMICVFFVFTYVIIMAQAGPSLIREIASAGETFRNREVNLILRLRNYDRIFHHIVFYDDENVDIDFDISDRKHRKLLAGDLLNLHEGMRYRVRFVVLDVGGNGAVAARLEAFSPYLLERLNEENSGPGHNAKKAE